MVLTGGGEEERCDECRKALPGLVVSMSLLLLLAWKEQVVPTKLIGK